MRDAAGEFDDFQAALHVAARIGQHLAMLVGEHAGQLVHVLLDQRFEIEHHARAALRIDGRPFGKHLQRGVHGLSHFGAVGERHLGLNFTRRRIEHVAETAGRPLHKLPGDEMRKFFHDDLTLLFGSLAGAWFSEAAA